MERALQVLLSFDEKHLETGISEISRRLGMPKSMVFRIVQTLEKMRFLERSRDPRKLQLGPVLFRLGFLVRQQFELRRIALPVIQRLARETDETVHLSVPDLEALRAVTIETVESSQPIRSTTRVGYVGYLHAGATRKCILAFLSEDVWEDVIHKVGLPKITDKTITDPEALRKDLRTIREQGYSFTAEEMDYGSAGVAAPIFDYTGALVGSITVSGPSYRFVEGRTEQIIALAKAAAAEISGLLGYRP